MTIPVTSSTHFDAGGGSPYATALRSGGGMLRMIDHDGAPGAPVELARFLAAADDADRSVLVRSTGAILDVGCGPGRMVRAAIVAGHLSLGVDVSDAAVAHAHAQGLPVLHRSVFDPIPARANGARRFYWTGTSASAAILQRFSRGVPSSCSPAVWCSWRLMPTHAVTGAFGPP